MRIHPPADETDRGIEILRLLKEFPIGTHVFVEPLYMDEDSDEGCLVPWDHPLVGQEVVIIGHDPKDWFLPFSVELLHDTGDPDDEEYMEAGNAEWVSRVSHILPLDVPTFTSREEADTWLNAISKTLS